MRDEGLSITDRGGVPSARVCCRWDDALGMGEGDGEKNKKWLNQMVRREPTGSSVGSLVQAIRIWFDHYSVQLARPDRYRDQLIVGLEP